MLVQLVPGLVKIRNTFNIVLQREGVPIVVNVRRIAVGMLITGQEKPIVSRVLPGRTLRLERPRAPRVRPARRRQKARPFVGPYLCRRARLVSTRHVKVRKHRHG